MNDQNKGQAEDKKEVRESFILCIICSLVSFAMILACFLLRSVISGHPGVLAVVYGVLMILLVLMDC